MDYYRYVIFEQYRTLDPVPRFEEFSANSDDEAIDFALMCKEVIAADYFPGCIWLKGVVRLKDGKPKMIIFEDGKKVQNNI